MDIPRKSFTAIASHLGTEIAIYVKISPVVLAHNIAPTAGTHISPITALSGGVQLLDDLRWSHLSEYDLHRESVPYLIWGDSAKCKLRRLPS